MAYLARRVVILGAGGMLGHVAALHLREAFGEGAHFQARRLSKVPGIDQNLVRLDATDTNAFLRWLDSTKAEVVVNCIGRKLSPNRSVPPDLHFLNADLPGILAEHLDARHDGSRLIQISSDGVFAGHKGDYTEAERPDADDPYGLSKIRGEIVHGPHLTIRTSMVGHSLSGQGGLLDWFLRSAEPIRGYSRCYWNGVTTLTLARFLELAVQNQITGLVHLGGEKVSKLQLLQRFGEAYQREFEILASPEPVIDTSLRSIRAEIDFPMPPLISMLEEFRAWYRERINREV